MVGYFLVSLGFGNTEFVIYILSFYFCLHLQFFLSLVFKTKRCLYLCSIRFKLMQIIYIFEGRKPSFTIPMEETDILSLLNTKSFDFFLLFEWRFAILLQFDCHFNRIMRHQKENIVDQRIRNAPHYYNFHFQAIFFSLIWSNIISIFIRGSDVC